VLPGRADPDVFDVPSQVLALAFTLYRVSDYWAYPVPASCSRSGSFLEFFLEGQPVSLREADQGTIGWDLPVTLFLHSSESGAGCGSTGRYWTGAAGAHLKRTNKDRVDETYIRIKGEDRYRYRAVDSTGQTIEFLLTPKRDQAAINPFRLRAEATGNRGGPHDSEGARILEFSQRYPQKQ
jgi:DDE superfamily endonuclease